MTAEETFTRGKVEAEHVYTFESNRRGTSDRDKGMCRENRRTTALFCLLAGVMLYCVILR